MSDVAEAFKATTAIVASSKTTEISSSNTSLLEVWAKNAISKLKSSNVSEKSELQRLNKELETYLHDVRVLEGKNRFLIEEVDRAKQLALPKLMDKSGFDKQVEDIRFQLEKQSTDCVNYEIKVDDAKSLVDHITQRLKFFQIEGETQKQKINALENRLAEISGERNHLLRSAKIAEDDIARDQNKIIKSEQELENLRKQLSNNRLMNKKIEFEIQTLQDELSFRKAVFNEESTELRTQFSKGGNVIPAVDLSNFYKNELAIAVRQIRDDFQRLNAQQMQDYKQVKENELSIFTQQIEIERVQAQKAKAKMDANMEAESMTSIEISKSLESNKIEVNRLNSQYGDLKNRLSTLEEHLAEIKLRNSNTLEKQDNEILRLKDQNNSFANELEYWERVTRNKLECEIQTYRSILNSQLKLVQNANANVSGVIISGATTKPSSQSSSSSKVIINSATNSNRTGTSPSSQTVTTTTTTTVTVKTKNEAINILRQVFNYFDRDGSGTINSVELDNVLNRLNIKLSPDAYRQIMKEADRDGSRTIDFSEFCQIMIPVFTGTFDDDELWYAFKKFDLDGSNTITVDELKQILSKVGQFYSDRQIESMIATVDANGDGKLNFQEFKRLMKSPPK